MKKLKHSKFKNTGILFELLIRQITADILDSNESDANKLVKKYFAEDDLHHNQLIQMSKMQYKCLME